LKGMPNAGPSFKLHNVKDSRAQVSHREYHEPNDGRERYRAIFALARPQVHREKQRKRHHRRIRVDRCAGDMEEFWSHKRVRLSVLVSDIPNSKIMPVYAHETRLQNTSMVLIFRAVRINRIQVRETVKNTGRESSVVLTNESQCVRVSGRFHCGSPRDDSHLLQAGGQRDAHRLRDPVGLARIARLRGVNHAMAHAQQQRPRERLRSAPDSRKHPRSISQQGTGHRGSPCAGLWSSARGNLHLDTITQDNWCSSPQTGYRTSQDPCFRRVIRAAEWNRMAHCKQVHDQR